MTFVQSELGETFFTRLQSSLGATYHVVIYAIMGRLIALVRRAKSTIWNSGFWFSGHVINTFQWATIGDRAIVCMNLVVYRRFSRNHAVGLKKVTDRRIHIEGSYLNGRPPMCRDRLVGRIGFAFDRKSW